MLIDGPEERGDGQLLPLHAGMQERPTADSPNAGLLFDKYLDKWHFANGTEPGPTSKEKSGFYAGAAGSVTPYSSNLAKAYIERRRRLLYALKGRAVSASTGWRLVSGLGSTHPLETGFIWHRTLGVPYLPGSSVKGMMRAWLTHWIRDAERADTLFGDSGDTGMGRLIVFDAIPMDKVILEVDIMNPHYSDYYKDPERNLPADYGMPSPVNFLVVAPGQRFEFALAPVSERCTDEDLSDGIELLKQALSTIGCGAKTAVGYGVFRDFRDTTSANFAARATAETAKLGLAQMSRGEHRIYELQIMMDGERDGDSEIIRVSSELFFEIDSFEGDDKLIVARGLKAIWEQIGRWSGKQSPKQQRKVEKIKQLLGEV